MQKSNINQQLEIIKRGATEIISEEELIQKLKESIDENRPLRIKAGFDPTAPDIHLGHTVLLKKLRQFQDLGHQVYFLIGDFTGTIGDPSGQDKIRKRLTEEEINRNALTYKKQVFKILDPKKTEVVFNSAWFKKMTSSEILNLASYATVAQILARQDFNQRYAQGRDISLLEIFYPLLQAFDSVHLKADVEIGGGDQKFNLLLGRELQRDFKQKQQAIIMLPLLEGVDGIQKMSKSYGNYVGINEAPNEMFGKIMSISDELMLKYYELLTEEDLNKIKNMHPKDAKLNLAKIIIAQYHDSKKADEAEKEFLSVFSEKGLPSDMPIYKLTKAVSIVRVLQDCGLVKTGNEARRLISQNAVIFNGKKIGSDKFIINEAGILKAGSRRFIKIVK